MINLIPNEEKKKMARGFYLRFWAVFFFMLGTCSLLAAFAISPSYLLASFREKLINESLAVQKNDPLPEVNQRALLVAEDLNSKLNIIDQARKKKFVVSERVISELVLNKMADIKIRQIFYEVTPAGEKRVKIQGTAPSRERLVVFRRALEDSLAWQKIDLPISNFVRGSNIEFTLTLTPLEHAE